MMKIILSADDFGRSHSRNVAIDVAIKKSLIKSAALMINSDYTEEALKLARGGYLNMIHLHLSLAYGEEMSGNSKPLSSQFADCSVFCENGEFKHPFYNELDFWKYVSVTYTELEAQYLKFKRVTDNAGNLGHLDVHLYNNRSYPFASAFCELIKNYDIKSARYFGVHHFTQKQEPFEENRIKLASMLCGNKACVCKSCNVDYFLTNKDEFVNDDIVELYVHPDYIDGVLMDNTISCFGHEKQTLEFQIDSLKKEGVDFISWTDI